MCSVLAGGGHCPGSEGLSLQPHGVRTSVPSRCGSVCAQFRTRSFSLYFCSVPFPGLSIGEAPMGTVHTPQAPTYAAPLPLEWSRRPAGARGGRRQTTDTDVTSTPATRREQPPPVPARGFVLAKQGHCGSDSILSLLWWVERERTNQELFELGGVTAESMPVFISFQVSS